MKGRFTRTQVFWMGMGLGLALLAWVGADFYNAHRAKAARAGCTGIATVAGWRGTVLAMWRAGRGTGMRRGN